MDSAIASSTLRPQMALLFSCLVVGTAFYLIDIGTFSVRGLSSELEELGDKISEGRVTRQLGFVLLGTFGCLTMLFVNERRFVPVNFLGALIAGYIFWVTLSIFWSSDPFISLKRIMVIYLMSLGAFSLSRLLSIRQIWYLVLITIGFFALISIAAELTHGVFTPWTASYRFGGPLHPNGQALHLSIFILAGVCLGLKDSLSERLLWIGFSLAVVLLLIMTKSRTAIISLLIALIYFSLLVTYIKRGWLALALLTSMILVASCLIIGVEISGQALNDLISIGRIESDTSTFSGRSFIWHDLLPNLWDRPIIGYGYGAFWSLERIEQISYSVWIATDAHSIYLDTILSIGIVGLTLLLAILFYGILRASIDAKRLNSNEYAGIAALLLYSLIHGIFESNLVSWGLFQFITMTVIATLAFPPVNAGRIQS